MTTERTLLQERLTSIIRRFAQRRILVIGDAIADQFIYGAISRVSREAPVFILRHEHTETTPGGAANCAMNLAALGASVALVSLVGEDEPGRALLERLKVAGVDCSGMIRSSAIQTTTKVRILGGQAHSTRQQVIRIDYDNPPLSDFRLRRMLQERADEKAAAAHAIIISDYNYGVAAEDIAAALRDSAAVPVLVDSRFQLANYPGFTSATPNEEEVETLVGNAVDEADLATVAESLRLKLGLRALLVTRGSHGMMLLEDGVEPLCLEAVGAREPVDVTGAGDTVIATYALALAAEASFPDAARLANYAGGLVVMKRGTATVSAEELAESVLR